VSLEKTESARPALAEADVVVSGGRGMQKGENFAILEQLTDLRSRSAEYLRRDGLLARDEQFFAEQNAVVVRDAERYYREMFGRGLNTWNLRDRHMAETLEALRPHLANQGGGDRVIVWAHNSHIGDARATAMGRRGELNIGELVRKRHGAEAVNVGFTTHQGTVTAASGWGEDPRLMSVNPSRSDSWEHALHDVGEPRFWVPLAGGAAGELGEERLERAIGVIYRPESERASHYFHAALERQFDLVVHIDRTAGIRPLDATEIWSDKGVPETYPFGT